MGSDSTCSWLSWPPEESVSVWMSGGVDVTSMRELTEPTAKTGLMLLTSPSDVMMSVTTVVPKPSLLTVNRKVPSANSGKLNFPLSSVVTVRSCPVVGFETLTVAPGTTAPWASRTVPVIRPGNSCATELPTAKVISTTTNEVKRENRVPRLAMAALHKRMRAPKVTPRLFVCQGNYIDISDLQCRVHNCHNLRSEEHTSEL